MGAFPLKSSMGVIWLIALGLASLASAEECVDHHDDNPPTCAEYHEWGYCSDPGHRPWLENNCALTCGYCEEGETVKPSTQRPTQQPTEGPTTPKPTKSDKSTPVPTSPPDDGECGKSKYSDAGYLNWESFIIGG